MATKAKLTLSEKINRAKDGRSQKWIVGKMNEAGCKISEVQFSRKKEGDVDFTETELIVLSELLGVELA